MDAENNIMNVGAYDLRKRGFAFLIGNSRYDDEKKLPELPEVRRDIQLMKNVLEGLRFEIVCKENKDKESMMNGIKKKILEVKFSEYSCVLFYFSGHGSNGTVCGTDGSEVDILKDIINPISSIKTLKRKPKLFFFDCCRKGTGVKAGAKITTPPDVYVAYAVSAHDSATDGTWTKFLAEAMLEGIFVKTDTADRWITSIHNVVTYARKMTFDGEQLSVSGDDSLLKMFFFKDFSKRRAVRKYMIHEHVFRRQPLRGPDPDSDSDSDPSPLCIECNRGPEGRHLFLCCQCDDVCVCETCATADNGWECAGSNRLNNRFDKFEKRHNRLLKKNFGSDSD